jgi:hypothetical protein
MVSKMVAHVACVPIEETAPSLTPVVLALSGLRHGRCHGEAGHCELPVERDPFDLRLPHYLQPRVQILTVTDQIKALVAEGKRKAAFDVFVHGPTGEGK